MATPASVISTLVKVEGMSQAARQLDTYDRLGRKASGGVDNLTRSTVSQGKALQETNKHVGLFNRSVSDTTRPTSAAASSIGNMAKAVFAAGGAFVAYGAAKEAITFTTDLTLATTKLTAITGMDAETSSSWIEIMKARGVATTQVQMGFITLAKNVANAEKGSKTASEAFARLGVSMDTLRSGDTSKILLAAADGFARIKSPMDRAALAQTLFGRNAKALIPLLVGGSDAIKEQLKQVQQYGAYIGGDAYNKLTRYHEALFGFKYALDGLKITFTEAVLPYLALAVGAIDKFIIQMRAGKGIGGEFASFVSGAFNTAKGAVIWMVNSVGGLHNFLIVLEAILGVFLAFKAVSAIMNAVQLAMNPMLWIAVALAAVAYLIIKNWGTIGPFLQNLWNNIRAFAEPIINWLINAWNNARNWIVAAWANLRDFANAVFPTIRSIVVTVFGVIAWYVNNILIPAFREIIWFITNILIPLWTTEFAIFRWVATASFNTVMWLWNNILHPVFNAIVWFLTTILIPIWRAQFNIMRSIAQIVFTAFKFFWDNILHPAFTAIKWVLENILVPYWRFAFSVITSVVRVAFNAIKVVWDVILHPVFNMIKNVIQNVTLPAFRFVFNTIRSIVQTVFGAIKSVWTGVLQPVFNAIKSAVHAVGDAFTSVFSGIRDTVHWLVYNVIGPIFNVFIGFVDTLCNVVNSVFGFLGVHLKGPGKIDLSSGVPAAQGGAGPPTIPRHARGGLVNSPMAIVGEEAPRHPEYVIATNPMYRRRNLGLLSEAAHALGAPGFAQGGKVSEFLVKASLESRGGSGYMNNPIQGRGYSELSVPPGSSAATWGSALGRLPYQYPLSISDINKSHTVVTTKQDIGSGSWGFMPVMGLYPDTVADLGMSGGEFNVWIHDDSRLQPVRFATSVAGLPGLGPLGPFGSVLTGILGQIASGGLSFIMSKLPGLDKLSDKFGLKNLGKTIRDKVGNWIWSKAQGAIGAAGGGGSGGRPGTQGPSGLGTFDGLQVANWIIPVLNWARTHGWGGHITSGYRPGYDPHTTTGVSEHGLTQWPGGAIDVGGPAAIAEGTALYNVLKGYPGPYPLLWGGIYITGYSGPGGHDYGHFSGTGHKMGGILGQGEKITGMMPPFGGAFADGGIVPGPYGAPRTIIAHGGEPVGVGGKPLINIENLNVHDAFDEQALAHRLAFLLEL